MHTLLTLTAAFALLTGYFEYIIEPAPAATLKPQAAAIVRDVRPDAQDTQPAPKSAEISPAEPEATKPPQPKIAKTEKTAPLNLALPRLDHSHQPIIQYQSLRLDVFNSLPDQEVSYNAELVYDAEKGESITGGKVNIKIPFG